MRGPRPQPDGSRALLADIGAADPADWRAQAACRGHDTNDFFVDKGRYRTAQPICARCPVRPECLYEELEIEPANVQHRFGMWGGLTGKQRHLLPALPASRTAAIAALKELLGPAPTAAPPSERTHQPMSTAPAPIPAPQAADTQPTATADVHPGPLAQVTDEPARPPLPAGRLIAWAADQDDKETRAHAEKARTSLQFLRERHQAAARLQHLHDEEARLEGQLAALREQKAQLLPKKNRAAKSYDATVVRAWARENNIPVPPVGRVPAAVVDAWRTATTPDSPQA